VKVTPGVIRAARPTGEHEFEAQHGLPEPLPPGERLLWQGGPHGPTLAREALHWRKLALYFAVLLGWRAANVLVDGGSVLQASVAVAWLLPLAALAVGIALTLAWLITRTTVYTLTDRRIVMRVGIVLSLSFNIPYRQIAAAAWRRGPDGRGDIVLTLSPGNRIAWLHLWPHARPWQLRQPQPMLRALPQVEQVGALLAEALRASAGLQAVPAVAGPEAVPVAPAAPVAPSLPRGMPASVEAPAAGAQRPVPTRLAA